MSAELRTGLSTSNGQGATTGQAPRSVRWFVGVLLVLLLIPGLVGFDVWPLTGWRLFSLSNRSCRERWVVEAVSSDGDVEVVSFEDLPLGYRHGEWAVARLAGSSVPLEADCPPPAPRVHDDPDGASPERREEVCRTFGDAVTQVRRDVVEVRLVRDRQRMVEEDGEWVLTRDPEVFHTCRI